MYIVREGKKWLERVMASAFLMAESAASTSFPPGTSHKGKLQDQLSVGTQDVLQTLLVHRVPLPTNYSAAKIDRPQ